MNSAIIVFPRDSNPQKSNLGSAESHGKQHKRTELSLLTENSCWHCQIRVNQISTALPHMMACSHPGLSTMSCLYPALCLVLTLLQPKRLQPCEPRYLAHRTNKCWNDTVRSLKCLSWGQTCAFGVALPAFFTSPSAPNTTMQ